MTLATRLFTFALVCALPLSSIAGSQTWDPLWIGGAQATKGSSVLPAGLSEADFNLESDSESNRSPAAARAKPFAAAKPTSKSKPVAAARAKAQASRWPSSASEGFEFKVRQGKQVSAIWVMKREGRFDLVFATNGGSRVNMTIPAEQFYALTNVATDLRAPASDMSKCKDSFVQLNVMSAESKGRPVAACLSAKGKAADALRQFGTALSSFVR